MEYIVSALVIIFLAIGIHEYAHAKLADMAGDPTPRIYGRVTLNLFKHFDPIGSLFIIITVLAGFGIGWGKPVPMDPRKMRNPRWDHFIAVIGGPVSNLIQAMIFAIILRALAQTNPEVASSFIGLFLRLGVTINLALFVFNLIPLGPLDGMWIVSTFLPEPARLNWVRFNLQVGTFLFLFLVLVGPFIGLGLGQVIFPVVSQIERFLGVPPLQRF